jgi:ABC-2 type transport system permease protein
MFLFMLLPLVIPVSIGAYSIVGEKTTRTLEPLLATPITTYELLSGKNLAGVIPAVVATWGGFILYALGAMFITGSPRVVRGLLDPAWILAVVFVGPLMAVLSVNLAIMISSRVNDPRVAEQLSTLVMVPVLALFFAQLSGVFIINRQFVIIAAAVMVLVDLLVLYLAVRLFQREVILTRWK